MLFKIVCFPEKKILNFICREYLFDISRSENALPSQKKTNQNYFYKIATNLTHLFGFA